MSKIRAKIRKITIILTLFAVFLFSGFDKSFAKEIKNEEKAVYSQLNKNFEYKNQNIKREIYNIQINDSPVKKIVGYMANSDIYIRQEELLGIIGLEIDEDDEEKLIYTQNPIEFDPFAKPYEKKEMNVRLKLLREKVQDIGNYSRLYVFKGFTLKDRESKEKNYLPLCYTFEKINQSNMMEEQGNNSKRNIYTVRYLVSKKLIIINTGKEKNISLVSSDNIMDKKIIKKTNRKIQSKNLSPNMKNQDKKIKKTESKPVNKSAKNAPERNSKENPLKIQIQRDEFLQSLNNSRVSKGLKPFKYNENLNKLAMDRTKTMIQDKKLSHNQRGKHAYDMAIPYGYSTNMVAENILYTNRKDSGKNMFDIWNKSKNHRDNMHTKDTAFGEIGFSIMKSDSENLYYSTLLIGQPK